MVKLLHKLGVQEEFCQVYLPLVTILLCLGQWVVEVTWWNCYTNWVYGNGFAKCSYLWLQFISFGSTSGLQK